MTQHTKEPWRIEPATKKDNWRIIGANGQVISTFSGNMDMENARRIVACVNACAGITVEMLEAMPSGPASLLPMYARLEQQRDQLQAQRDQLAQQLANLERLTGVYFPRGQELRREDHPELFKALQEQQPTPPNLPDLNGQFVKGGAEC